MKCFDWCKDLGFFIFPVSVGVKEPMKGFLWPQESSRDPFRWNQWGDKYAGCNWAVDCGKSNLAVIDIDAQNGGWPTWKEMEEQFTEDLPHTLWVDTPSGGAHIYFSQPKENKLPTQKILPGVEIRGLGSYVLIPPSTFKGKKYAIRTGYELKDITGIPPVLR